MEGALPATGSAATASASTPKGFYDTRLPCDLYTNPWTPPLLHRRPSTQHRHQVIAKHCDGEPIFLQGG